MINVAALVQQKRSIRYVYQRLDGEAEKIEAWEFLLSFKRIIQEEYDDLQ
jgi:hypothetical protein